MLLTKILHIDRFKCTSEVLSRVNKNLPASYSIVIVPGSYYLPAPCTGRALVSQQNKHQPGKREIYLSDYWQGLLVMGKRDETPESGAF